VDRDKPGRPRNDRNHTTPKSLATRDLTQAPDQISDSAARYRPRHDAAGRESLPADRREDRIAGRLARQDSVQGSRADQAGRP
jgi:hypothetical protein